MVLHCYLKIASRCHRDEKGFIFRSYRSHGIVTHPFLNGVGFVL